MPPVHLGLSKKQEAWTLAIMSKILSLDNGSIKVLTYVFYALECIHLCSA